MTIKELKLYTSQPKEQWAFYTGALGLAGRQYEDGSFTLQAGATRLAFVEGNNNPYYHFAFNIPPFQYREALEWLRERAPILRDGDTELIDFFNWNAYAMYFHDPAGNIVEFIARRGLKYRAVEPFSTSGILSVSEIGLPVCTVRESFELLLRESGVPFYSGNYHNFCAAGDPHGLFIIVDPRNKEWYPTDRPARSFPLELTFREQGRNYKLVMQEERLSITPTA